jgi:dihydrodipicolinate synthase/N-acetylneuraminate lyase
MTDGTIDGRGLARHLERIFPHVQAILLGSPRAGEGRNLSLEQRSDLLEKALVVIRGRLPLMIWVTGDVEEKTRKALVSLNKILKKRNYRGDIFWVDAPLYYHSNRGLSALYQNLASAVSEPFILHNDPDLIKNLPRTLKRNNIRTAILKELSVLNTIVGLIYLGTLDRAYNYRKACRGRTRFRIYDGDENQFLDHPSMSGVISVGANLTPKGWKRITQSSLQLSGTQRIYPDRIQQVWKLGLYLRDLLDVYHPTPGPIVKGVLSEMGVIKTPACVSPVEDLEGPISLIKEMMTRSGEEWYPANHP